MKKIFFPLVISAIIVSCENSPKQEDPATVQLSSENQKLLEDAKLKDSIIEEYFRAINEIEDNLDLIKQSERLVTISMNNESGMDSKNLIVEDIRLIGDLMLKNKERVSQLEKQMKNSSIKSKEFEKLIHRMELQLEEKNQDLERLRDELLKLNNSFENLFAEYNQRLDEIDKQSGKINTAYFAIGTAKELKENNITVREGRVAGLGKSTRLMKDFNKSYFTKIDIREATTIELFGKGAKLLSNHPGNSYAIEKNGNNEILNIINPEEFWSISKYLVVIVEQ